MDTITHTLFGLALYGAVKKPDMTRKQKGVSTGRVNPFYMNLLTVLHFRIGSWKGCFVHIVENVMQQPYILVYFRKRLYRYIRTVL
ncbi:hypothetical protein D1872_282320 [compost metagenome]